MSHFYFWIVVFLNLKTYAASEESYEERDITGAVGGAVTLQVDHTRVTIIWSFSDGPLTMVLQGLPNVMLPTEHKQFKGRLNSTSDGSLIINELKQEDQGTYKAQSFKNSKLEICYYHLTVFSNLTAEDVTISSNVQVTDDKTCEVTLTCSVNSVEESNVNIIWSSLNSSDITGKQNDVLVPFSNINFTYICTVENPVSKTSKDVHPWEYCENELRKQNTSMVTIKSLVISACLLLITSCFLLCLLKPGVTVQRPGAGGN